MESLRDESALTVRSLEPADAAACDEVVASLPYFFGDDAGVRECAEAVRRGPGFVGVVDGEVVGFLTLKRPFGRSAEITWMAVRADVRRRGIGRALVERAAADLSEEGVTVLSVLTLGPSVEEPPSDDSYAGSRAFYEAAGFTPVREFGLRSWNNDAALLLVRHLPTTRNPQSYDDLAEHYERREELDGDPIGEWLRTVVPEHGETAIDLGCGGGRHAVILADHFDSVVAVDASRAMIDLARSKRARLNIEYRVGDLRDAAGSYDLVFSSATLHHLADQADALDHVKGLVGREGTAILADVVVWRRHLPRWIFRLDALARLAFDAVTSRPHALERYRLATDARWLDHLTSDEYQTRAAFEQTYGSVFPSARFRPVGNLHTCVWQRRSDEP